MLKELSEKPMNMGVVIIEHSEKEKNLGDWIHGKGCKASISETIKVGTNGLVSKGEEIIQVSESPRMGENGNSLAAIKLYEAQVIPVLFFNSERLPRQIYEKVPRTTLFYAQSHRPLGLRTTTDEVEDR